MKKITLLLTVVFFLAGCSSNRVNTEFEFGNKLAKRGLWKEAQYRWTRALKGGEDSAALHNNLAISLEHQNKLKEAEAEYEKALKLSPGNEYIKRNLSRLKRRINPEMEPDSQEKRDPKEKKKKDKRRR